MEYIQYEVQKDLRPFIKCYWSLEAPEAPLPEKQRIVPDGCMEMIFHYGDLYKQYLSDGSFILQPRSFVFGQITTPLEIEPAGATGLIAARFNPDGFYPFTSMAVATMNNRAIALEDLFGKEGLALQEEVIHATGNELRKTIIESFLLNRLQTAEACERIASAAVQALLESKGQQTMEEISEKLQVNRRQLERKFATGTGLSPKQFSKIARLQAACRMIGRMQHSSLTALAYEAGYYDQAHFIKDFKEFTGLSPKQFYADSLKMSSLFMQAE